MKSINDSNGLQLYPVGQLKGQIFNNKQNLIKWKKFQKTTKLPN